MRLYCMKLECDCTTQVCSLGEEEISEFPVQVLEASFPYSMEKLHALGKNAREL